MIDHLSDPGATDSVDDWAMAFFQAILSEGMSVEEFEAAVNARWQAMEFVLRAPAAADWLKRQATAAWSDAGYAHDAPDLGFRSNFLIGKAGRPGAVYIEAPAEAPQSVGLLSLNRPLHQHDSGRIAVITSGAAVFHVLAGEGDGAVMLDCPVEAGDIIFWPAWTPHTFDALDGFSLVSAMAAYVSPAADGFLFPVDEDVIARPRRSFRSRPAA